MLRLINAIAWSIIVTVSIGTLLDNGYWLYLFAACSGCFILGVLVASQYSSKNS